MQDALTSLPFVPAAVTCAPLGHFHAAVAHIVGSHDGAWLQKEDKSRITGATLQTSVSNISLRQKIFIFSTSIAGKTSSNNISAPGVPVSQVFQLLILIIAGTQNYFLKNTVWEGNNITRIIL